jgi:hypothetical protein
MGVLVITPENCTNCHSCELACSLFHEEEFRERGIDIKHIIILLEEKRKQKIIGIQYNLRKLLSENVESLPEDTYRLLDRYGLSETFFSDREIFNFYHIIAQGGASGIYSGRTALSIGLWVTGSIFLVISTLTILIRPASFDHYYPKLSGFLLVGTGILFVVSCIVQFGPFLNGSAGISIPLGDLYSCCWVLAYPHMALYFYILRKFRGGSFSHIFLHH